MSKKKSCKDSAPKLRFGARTRKEVLCLSPPLPPTPFNSFRDPSRSGPRNQCEREIKHKAVCSARSAHGRCRYPEDQVPPRTGFRSRQKARHANHTPLRVVNLSINRTAWGSSGAAMCPAALAPAAQPGAAPGPPRVLWPQLPLPSPGQLRGRHVSCGLSSRCPTRGSFGAAACALEAQRSVSC
jgi:hypothetical protein